MNAKNQGSAYLLVVTIGITLGAAAFAAFTFSISRNRHSEVSILQHKARRMCLGSEFPV